MNTTRRPWSPTGILHLLAAALAASGWQAAQAVEPETGQARIESAGKIQQPTPDLRLTSVRQRADNLYRRAVVLLRSGQQRQALAALEQALKLLPTHHESRRAIALLLAADGDMPSATELLEQGLSLAPEQSDLRRMLARLQLAQGQPALAYRTLIDDSPSSVEDDDAETNALLAASLQRLGRHQEAVRHYLSSLRSNPTEPRWLIGTGISLQAQGLLADAAAAFERALDTGELMPEQAQFARRSLQQIGQRPERPR